MEIKVRKINSLKDIKYKDLKRFKELVILAENDDTHLTYTMLQIFYNIKREVAKKLSLEQMDDLSNDITSALNKGGEFNNIMEVGGVKYGFIPNFDKITAGELIDLDSLLQKDDMIGIMSILYRPIVGEVNKSGEYRIEEYNEPTEVFKDVSAFEVEGFLNFFIKSYQQLSQIIHSSSK